MPAMEEGRKRVLLIAAAIFAARKLAQFPSTPRVPATINPHSADNAKHIQPSSTEIREN